MTTPVTDRLRRALSQLDIRNPVEIQIPPDLWDAFVEEQRALDVERAGTSIRHPARHHPYVRARARRRCALVSPDQE